MRLAHTLGRTLEQVLSMSHYEVQLWFEYLWPSKDEPEPDLSILDRMCN